MPGVQYVDVRIGYVALVSLRSGQCEGWVVLAS